MKIIRYPEQSSSKASNYSYSESIKDRLDLLSIRIQKVINRAINSLKSLPSTFELFWKHRKYEVSLIYTLSNNYFNPKNQPYMSEIKINDKLATIWLGGIPLHNKNHIEDFQDKNIQGVLSLLEDFEYKKTFFSSPIQREDYEKLNIDQLKIEATDFAPLSFEQIDIAVEYIKENIDNENLDKNQNIYIHCKAGKGRSVTAVCCYLIKYHNMTAKKAIDFVKEKRCNINLNKYQIARIEKYEKNKTL